MLADSAGTTALLTEATFPEPIRLGTRLARLLADLRDLDKLPIGPREEVAIYALAPTVLDANGPSGLANASADQLLQLRSWLAPILVRNADELERFNARFETIFGSSVALPKAGGPDPLDLPVGPVTVPRASVWSAIVSRFKAMLPVLLAVVVLGSAIAVYRLAPAAWRFWESSPPPAVGSQVQTGPLAAGQARDDGSAPATERMTLDEVRQFATRAAGAAGAGQRGNLYGIADRLAWGYGATDRYRRLVMTTGWSPDRVIDVADPKALLPLAAAVIHIEAPGRAFARADLEQAVTETIASLAKTRAADASPPTKLPLASGAWIIPWWLLGLLSTLAVAPMAIWLVRRIDRKRAFLSNALDKPRNMEVRRLEVKDEAVREIAEASRTLNLAARHLSARMPVGVRSLDPDRTVIASAGNGGRFAPVFAERRTRPEHLFLIATSGPNDHQAERMSWIVEELTALEVPIERFYIEHDANRVFQTRGEKRFKLTDLHARYPDHRLIVLGMGDGFLNPGTLAAHAWASDVRLWPSRALATPVPPSEWTGREATLAQLFGGPLHHATPDGLAVLAERLRREEAPDDGEILTQPDGPIRSWRFDPRRWLINLPTDETREWRALETDLASYLDGPAREWLQAAAVYPALRWDLTLYLGLKLTGSGPGPGGGRPLYSEDRAVRLCLLPWFRAGRMPEWIRCRFIAEIAPERRAEITQLIGELLLKAVDPGPGRTVIRLPIATTGAASGAGPRPQRHDVASDDAVLLDFLAREDTSAFEPPRRFVDQFIKLDTFKGAEWRTGTLPVAYALAGLLVVPKPWDGPLAPGAWWPIALLAAGAATWPVARWVRISVEARL